MHPAEIAFGVRRTRDAKIGRLPGSVTYLVMIL